MPSSDDEYTRTSSGSDSDAESTNNSSGSDSDVESVEGQRSIGEDIRVRVLFCFVMVDDELTIPPLERPRADFR